MSTVGLMLHIYSLVQSSGAIGERGVAVTKELLAHTKHAKVVNTVVMSIVPDLKLSMKLSYSSGWSPRTQHKSPHVLKLWVQPKRFPCVFSSIPHVQTRLH